MWAVSVGLYFGRNVVIVLVGARARNYAPLVIVPNIEPPAIAWIVLEDELQLGGQAEGGVGEVEARLIVILA